MDKQHFKFVFGKYVCPKCLHASTETKRNGTGNITIQCKHCGFQDTININ